MEAKSFTFTCGCGYEAGYSTDGALPLRHECPRCGKILVREVRHSGDGV